jgi:protein gp37
VSARWGDENYWGRGAKRRFFGPKHWNELLRWNRKAKKEGLPALVFCSSMCDWLEMHPNPDITERQEQERKRLFALIDETPWLIWLMLSKRLENWHRCVPQDWLWKKMPRNVWLGATICNQEELETVYPEVETIERMYHPAMTFLSLEPMLSSMDLVEGLWQTWVTGFDEVEYEMEPRDRPIWLIPGGESRQRGKCRKTELQWLLDVIEYGKEFNQPVFVKQLGHLLAEELGATGKGVEPAEWPEALRVQQFPFARVRYQCPERTVGAGTCSHPDNADRVCFHWACPVVKEVGGGYL